MPAPEYLVFLGSADDPAIAGASTSYAPVVLGLTGEGVVKVSGGCSASVADEAGRSGVGDGLLAPPPTGPRW